jgi:hypothetical protein
LFHPAVVILPADSTFGEGDRVVPAPEEEGVVDELATAVTVDGVEGEEEEEAVSGILKGFFDPFVSLVSHGVMDSPAGSQIGHGEGVAKRSRWVSMATRFFKGGPDFVPLLPRFSVFLSLTRSRSTVETLMFRSFSLTSWLTG